MRVTSKYSFAAIWDIKNGVDDILRLLTEDDDEEEADEP